jgi:hypothetical protein
MQCPKCSQVMEPGFLVDRGGGPADLQARWVEGPPEPKNFWRNGVNLQDREPVSVTTFRCTGCGFLESFARRPTSS